MSRLPVLLFLLVGSSTIQGFPSQEDAAVNTGSAVGDHQHTTHLVDHVLHNTNILWSNLPTQLFGLKSVGDFSRVLQEGTLRILLGAFNLSQRSMDMLTNMAVYLLREPHIHSLVDRTIENLPELTPIFQDIQTFLVGPDARPLRLAYYKIYHPLEKIYLKLDIAVRKALMEAYEGLEEPRSVLLVELQSKEVQPALERLKVLPEFTELSTIAFGCGVELNQYVEDLQANNSQPQVQEGGREVRKSHKSQHAEPKGDQRLETDETSLAPLPPNEFWNEIFRFVDDFLEPFIEYLQLHEIESRADIILKIRNYGDELASRRPELAAEVNAAAEIVIYILNAPRVKSFVDNTLHNLPELPKLARALRQFFEDPANAPLREAIEKALKPLGIVIRKLQKALRLEIMNSVRALDPVAKIVRKEIRSKAVQKSIGKLVALKAFSKLNRITEKYGVHVLVLVKKLKGTTLRVKSVPDPSTFVKKMLVRARLIYKIIQKSRRPSPTILFTETIHKIDVFILELPQQIQEYKIQKAEDLLILIQRDNLFSHTLTTILHLRERFSNLIVDFTAQILKESHVQNAIDIFLENLTSFVSIYRQIQEFFQGPDAAPLVTAFQDILPQFADTFDRLERALRRFLRHAPLVFDAPARILTQRIQSPEVEPIFERFLILPETVELNKIGEDFGLHLLRSLELFRGPPGQSQPKPEISSSQGRFRRDEQENSSPTESASSLPIEPAQTTQSGNLAIPDGEIPPVTNSTSSSERPGYELLLGAKPQFTQSAFDLVDNYVEPFTLVLKLFGVGNTLDLIRKIRSLRNLLVWIRPGDAAPVSILAEIFTRILEEPQTQSSLDTFLQDLPQIPPIMHGIQRFLSEPENKLLHDTIEESFRTFDEEITGLIGDVMETMSVTLGELTEFSYKFVREQFARKEVLGVFDKLINFSATVELNRIFEKYGYGLIDSLQQVLIIVRMLAESSREGSESMLN